MSARMVHGDCLEEMRRLASASIDAIVTDLPYGLKFMGKAWDHGIPGVPYWAEALRVAKPGAHLLAFGGTRTYHRLTCAIEDAGWAVRDCLTWLYGTGFPKSHNLPGGLGTALKPAWEPIILARKPLACTVAANVTEHGTGALNVDRCRLPARGVEQRMSAKETSGTYGAELGRWPANVVLDEEAAALLDAQSGVCTSRPARADTPKGRRGGGFVNVGAWKGTPGPNGPTYGDQGGASRFFFCAKASRGERERGLRDLPTAVVGRSSGAATAADRGEDYDNGDGGFNRTVSVRNTHNTVKPVALMRWLCRLGTPPGGLILDPFAGSGSTGVAAVAEAFRCSAQAPEHGPLFADATPEPLAAILAEMRTAFVASLAQTGLRMPAAEVQRLARAVIREHRGCLLRPEVVAGVLLEDPTIWPLVERRSP